MIENGKRDTRKRGARISPRSLSPLTRQLIVDEFRACGDMESVAKTYNLPVRTIDSVLHWVTLRKPPVVEQRMNVLQMRSTA